MKISKDRLKEIIREELQLLEKSKGLWHNIHAKRKRGEKPAKPGDKDYPKTLDIEEYDVVNEQDYKSFISYMKENYSGLEEGTLEEAEYQGRKVKLGKPTQGDVKKFKVYVKNPKGNVVKVNFGHGGSSAKGKTMSIKKNNPEARKSFRARHKCDQDKPRTSAGYWSCKKW